MIKKNIYFVHQLQTQNKNGDWINEGPPVCNLVPDAGIDFLIGAPFGDASPIANFYCGLFVNNYVPTSSTAPVDIPSGLGEFTQYSELARPEWNKVYDDDGTYTNDASPAVFTPTADATVYGSFIVSSSTKSSTSGLLLSVARFDTTKALTIGNAARLKTSLTYTPADVI